MGKLQDLTIKLAKDKKIEITSFRARRIWDIDRKFEKKEISLDEAIRLLQSEFSYHISRWDWEEIRKEMKYY